MSRDVITYEESARVDSAPECVRCDKHCCYRFIICDGYPLPYHLKYLRENIPQFKPLPESDGWYTCEWATPEGCAHYADRPMICVVYPSNHQVNWHETRHCKLVARLWEEKFGDYPEEGTA